MKRGFSTVSEHQNFLQSERIIAHQKNFRKVLFFIVVFQTFCRPEETESFRWTKCQSEAFMSKNEGKNDAKQHIRKRYCGVGLYANDASQRAVAELLQHPSTTF